MKKRITVHVSQSNIRASRKALTEGAIRETHCPVALALRSAGLTKTLVTKTQIISSIRGVGSDAVSIQPSRPVVRFIHDFDNGRKSKPFSFRLSVEPELLPLLGWKEAA